MSVGAAGSAGPLRDGGAGPVRGMSVLLRSVPVVARATRRVQLAAQALRRRVALDIYGGQGCSSALTAPVIIVRPSARKVVTEETRPEVNAFCSDVRNCTGSTRIA